MAPADLARMVLEDLRVQLDGGQALDMRLGRLLAYTRSLDLAPLGFSSATAFWRERVEWSGTWLRQIVRLADSDLPLVRAAASLGFIPLSLAVMAPGRVRPEDQMAWLFDIRDAKIDFDPPGEGCGSVVVSGAALAAVQAARLRARLCIGREVSEAQVDEYILACWRECRSGVEILEEARIPPAPPPLGPPPQWGPVEDPATPLVGAFVAPGDAIELAEQVARVQKVRRQRIVAIGHLYRSLADGQMYRHLGFSSLRELVHHNLRCSVRSLQRYGRFAERMSMHPLVVQAVNAGLDLERARLVLALAPDSRLERWLKVAGRIGIGELVRIRRLCGASQDDETLLRYYERAIAMIPEATDTVSLRASQAKPRAPRQARVHRDLPKAALWFMENVKIEGQKGFGKVKERDDFTCQNPECGRRSLRVEAHHIHFRSNGGDDSLENGVSVCRACHLRLIHTGRVTVERKGDMLVWTYPDRRVLVM